MTLFYRVVGLFFISISFSSFSGVRWPQSATPFFCGQRGGFFVHLENGPRFCDHFLSRTMLLPTSVITLSAEKKIMRFNGKKVVHTDMTIYGKELLVNGMYAGIAVHCSSHEHGIAGYVIGNASDMKKNIRKRQVRALFPIDDTMQLWDESEQRLCSELEDAFALIAQAQSMVVRVLLSSYEACASAKWVFCSEKGFWVYSVDQLGQLTGKKVFCTDIVTVSIKNGTLFCNGKKVSYALRLQPLSGSGECDGIMYDGDFCITPHKNSILCINHVELEDYIGAVLRTESWPGWPLEINKVFAIACRSYVASQAVNARRSGRPFHVKNSNVHQTYRGKHDIAVLKQAVNQTRGVVLGFNGKPILAMFDCCCGGVIPAHVDDFDFKKAPYLARTYACNYCKSCSLYSWIVSYDHKKLHDLCKENMIELKVVRDVNVIKKDKAGLVTQVRLKGHNNHVTLSGKKLYSLLKDVKSFHFDITKKADNFIVSGRGFGHHMGLCQWGAREMVRDGWDYKSILQFYYPQTQFMKLM
jgi:stage II sporulation protein D